MTCQPIRTDFGWHVVQLRDVQAGEQHAEADDAHPRHHELRQEAHIEGADLGIEQVGDEPAPEPASAVLL